MCVCVCVCVPIPEANCYGTQMPGSLATLGIYVTCTSTSLIPSLLCGCHLFLLARVV